MGNIYSLKSEQADECEQQWHMRLFMIAQFLFQFILFFVVPFLLVQHAQHSHHQPTRFCVDITLWFSFVFMLTSVMISFIVYEKEELAKQTVHLPSNATVTCMQIYESIEEKCGVGMPESCKQLNLENQTLYWSQQICSIVQLCVLLSILLVCCIKNCIMCNIFGPKKPIVDFSLIDNENENDML